MKNNIIVFVVASAMTLASSVMAEDFKYTSVNLKWEHLPRRSEDSLKIQAFIPGGLIIYTISTGNNGAYTSKHASIAILNGDKNIVCDASGMDAYALTIKCGTLKSSYFLMIAPEFQESKLDWATSEGHTAGEF